MQFHPANVTGTGPTIPRRYCKALHEIKVTTITVHFNGLGLDAELDVHLECILAKTHCGAPLQELMRTLRKARALCTGNHSTIVILFIRYLIDVTSSVYLP